MNTLLQHWNNQDLSKQVSEDTLYSWADTYPAYIQELLQELCLQTIEDLSESELRAYFAVWLDDNEPEAYEYYSAWADKLQYKLDSYENC